MHNVMHIVMHYIMHRVMHNVMHNVMHSVLHERRLRMHSWQYAYCNIVPNCCGPLIVACITLNMYYEMHIVHIVVADPSF